MVTAGNGPWWLTTSGASALSTRDQAAERHLRAVAARHEHVCQVGGVALEARVDLEHDAILVALGVDGRDLPLREGVVEGAVDVLDAHAEPGRHLPVDGDVGLQPALLAVAGDVDDAGHLAQPLDDLRQPGIERIELGAPEGQLVLGAALARADADVLRGVHEHVDALHAGKRPAQAVDDALGGEAVALGERLEADEHAALVDRGVEARGADRGADGGHGGIGQHDVERLALQLQHGVVGDVGGGPRRAEDQAGVVLGEVALGRLDVEVDRHGDGGEHDDAHQQRGDAATALSVRM